MAAFFAAGPLRAQYFTTMLTGTVSSAGVFDSTGLLVRTLWSASANDPRANNPAPAWDGTLDDGSVAPTGTYTIQVLFSNVAYNWEGVIGNSGAQPHTNNVYSMAFNGFPGTLFSTNYHTHGGSPQGLTITPGGEIYMTTQYDERYHVMCVATTADPQTNNTILTQGFRFTLQGQDDLCSDGTNVYLSWGGAYSNGKSSMVWGINQLTKRPAFFPSGRNESGDVPIEAGIVYGIGDYTDTGDGSSAVSGVAVQQSGNILFFSRPALERIYTANKTSGAVLQIFTGFTLPRKMACNPVTGDLWVIHQLVTATFPAFAAINLRILQGSSVTAKFTAASFTYTPPTGYAALNGTLDPTTLKGGMVLSGGNLTVGNPSTGSGDANYAYSQNSAIKFYFEILVNADSLNLTDNAMLIGIVPDTSFNDSFSLGAGLTIGWANSSFGFGSVYGPNGAFRGTFSGVGYTTGDNIGVAVDCVNQKIWWRKNGGNWNNIAAGDPVAGTNGVNLNGIAAPTLTPQISKMTVDGAGNLTDTGIAINGLSNPFALAISPDGSMALVGDVGTHQIKAFNTADGSVKTAWGNSGTLGDLNGYANGPAVSNTRYMFNTSVNSSSFNIGGPSICFAPDGSFWFRDPGNWRVLHFSSGNAPSYIEQIKYDDLSSGACAVHLNDDTRVYSGFLEYKIDYTKPLDGGANGSWKLVNNWYQGLPPGAAATATMRYAGTFSNGRSYAPVMDTSINAFRIMEMTTSGWRDTGVQTPEVYVDRGFNLWTISSAIPGQQVVYKKNALTAFDGSGNPIYAVDPTSGAYTPILTSQVLPANFPPTGNFHNIPSYMVEALANGVVPVFNPDGTFGPPTNGNHVGGIDSATGLVKFQAHPSTGKNRGGPNTFLRFPEVPYFDQAPSSGGTGNDGVGPNLGGAIWYKPGAIDFFTGYPGEGWGNNQTNIWHHWHQTGLLIGRFGVVEPYFGHIMFLDGSFTHVNGPNFYRFPLSPPAITVAAWINPSILDTNFRNVWTSVAQQAQIYNALLGVINSNAAFCYGNANNIVAGSLVTGTWYRVVGTVDNTGAKLYVNGVQVGSTGPGATLSTVNLSNVNIGKGFGNQPIGPGTNPFFGGSVSDVAVWNTALTPSQVASLNTQRANTIGANANLVGYWPITGDHFEFDQSGNNNHSFAGLPVVAGPPGQPLFNGTNNAVTFNGTSDFMLLNVGNPDNAARGGSSFRGMPAASGNGKWGGLALNNGKYYLYYNDEWYHGGKHRWRIDNLASIHLGPATPVNWNSASYVPPSAGPPDLLAALPYDTANLPNNTAGWVRNPTSDSTSPQLNIFTNAIIANRHSSPDLVIQGVTTSAAFTATLSNSWTRSGSGNWSMNASMHQVGEGEGVAPGRHLYIDILDNTGKKLVRMENARLASNEQETFQVNGTPITPVTFESTTGVWASYYQNERPLLVTANVGAGTMQVTFGDFTISGVTVLDAGADLTKPSQFRLTWTQDAGAQAGIFVGVCFTKLVFNI